MRCWRADQRISWWAGELKRAGLEGGMDELRARAFLDLVLGKDSRPRAPEATDASRPGWRSRRQVPPRARVRPEVRQAGSLAGSP